MPAPGARQAIATQPARVQLHRRDGTRDTDDLRRLRIHNVPAPARRVTATQTRTRLDRLPAAARRVIRARTRTPPAASRARSLGANLDAVSRVSGSR
ncbi:hypothetical protein Ade02nite_51640 [Paractinoplanes deccanensis]|uniref:Uncharacterized protein n=1 Tax=Paractinoplanes deccanensis TaxID=113561 RepID=A0ABQ3Y925_9ACTN|nr:hypothetical protein Ade02nite_51640 [Actinoplanes deccanensis]